jgi:hypothetical protein
MIIYGVRNKELAKEVLLDKCTFCGTSNSIDMYVFQKYAHIFWIPFFPFNKTGISQCDHCKQVLKSKEMPPSLKESYNILKAQTKTPIWMFSASAIAAFLITMGIISDKENDKENAQQVLAPKKGDLFSVKTSATSFTLYKVEQVEADSVFVRINNFVVDRRTGIEELKEKQYNDYSEEVYGYSKQELKKMLEKEEIIDIDRK